MKSKWIASRYGNEFINITHVIKLFWDRVDESGHNPGLNFYTKALLISGEVIELGKFPSQDEAEQAIIETINKINMYPNETN